MEEKTKIRQPKQLRSKNMKEKLLDTAMELFCERGYHQTTTNEIAKKAGVSIGSLYSYFKNKEAILYEIMGLYHEQFLVLHGDLLESVEAYKANKKLWLRTLIEKLIRIHEESSRFNRELNILYYSDAKVREILDRQRNETRQIMLKYATIFQNDIQVSDVEAATLLAYDFISAIVDRIVFGDGGMEKERLLTTGVEAIYKFLNLKELTD